jgi:hypothetical protein
MVKHWNPQAAAVAGTLLGLALIPAGADAQESRSWADRLALDPIQWEFDNTQIRIGGFAGGALFAAAQEGGPGFPDGYENTGATALATSNVRIQRTFDNGLVLGARGDFLLYRDRLSTDAYDNDTVQRVYVFTQTGFGRLEIGQVDGAAYTLGLTGPLVDQQVTLENRNFSLFRDPTTGEDFGGFFRQITSVQASSNYAKLNYVSPRLLGIQVGASFTPQTVRTPLPFTGNPSDDPNQQRAIWELAASYTGYFSDVAVGLTGGLAHGRLMNRTEGHDDLVDWAVGTQLAYSIDDTKITFGGAYRGSNAHLLDIEQVRDDSRSRMVQLSATVEKPMWLAGVEFSTPISTAWTRIPSTDFSSRRIQDQLQYAAQRRLAVLRLQPCSGVFYNGQSEINMNAAFCRSVTRFNRKADSMAAMPAIASLRRAIVWALMPPRA